MSITLGFSVAESGDSKIITITDTTGTATGGWDGSPATTDINGTTNKLTLDIVVTRSDGIETTYDQINLYTTFGAFANVAALVFPLTCANFKINSVPIGTSSTTFSDGLYNITYTYTGSTGTKATVLIDGIIKGKLYSLIRTIPTKYECDDPHDKDILDIIFMKGYYDALIATAEVGRSDQVIDQLLVLERLVLNGSNYSW